MRFSNLRANSVTALFVFFLPVSLFAQTPEEQIAMAVQAAPEALRTEATVYGYDEEGEFMLLREGSNDIICISDDPKRSGFQVVAYHKDMEPFMKRGRELKAEGKTADEVFAIREEEAKNGELEMPDHPCNMTLLEGTEVTMNPATGELGGVYLRSVVYIPWATSESTGLPPSPTVPGGPWIMNPGTHRAHIMITPPRETQD